MGDFGPPARQKWTGQDLKVVERSGRHVLEESGQISTGAAAEARTFWERNTSVRQGGARQPGRGVMCTV